MSGVTDEQRGGSVRQQRVWHVELPLARAQGQSVEGARGSARGNSAGLCGFTITLRPARQLTFTVRGVDPFGASTSVSLGDANDRRFETRSPERLTMKLVKRREGRSARRQLSGRDFAG